MRETWWQFSLYAILLHDHNCDPLSIVVIDQPILSPRLSFLGCLVDNHRSGTRFRAFLLQFLSTINLVLVSIFVLVVSVILGCKKAVGIPSKGELLLFLSYLHVCLLICNDRKPICVHCHHKSIYCCPCKS